jgi:hypothetical protein
MADTVSLIVSNPPHSASEGEDLARLVEIDAEEAGRKIAYALPEIWFAHGDRERVEEAARALGRAGLDVIVADGRELAALAITASIRSFEFGDAGLALHTSGADADLRYEGRMCIVRSRPDDRSSGATRAIGRRSSSVFSFSDRISGPSLGGAEESEQADPPFIDLYVSLPQGTERYRAAIGKVSFAGLGKNVQPRAIDNLGAMAEALVSRFSNAREDHRLVGMTLRVPHPIRPDDRRRGYSYATPALDALLATIDPALADISHSDLASRLSFLTLTRERQQRASLAD